MPLVKHLLAKPVSPVLILMLFHAYSAYPTLIFASRASLLSMEYALLVLQTAPDAAFLGPAAAILTSAVQVT